MIQLNPAFVPGGDVGKFVDEGLLHPECERIFRFGKSEDGNPGKALTLYKHQEEAVRNRGSAQIVCPHDRHGVWQEPELLHPDH